MLPIYLRRNENLVCQFCLEEASYSLPRRALSVSRQDITPVYHILLCLLYDPKQPEDKNLHKMYRIHFMKIITTF